MPVFSLLASTKALIVAGVLTVAAVGASTYVSAKVGANQTNADAALTGYTKDQCKNGGWQAMGFRNQGQCVSYFVPAE